LKADSTSKRDRFTSTTHSDRPGVSYVRDRLREPALPRSLALSQSFPAANWLLPVKASHRHVFVTRDAALPDFEVHETTVIYRGFPACRIGHDHGCIGAAHHFFRET
jgi:hypothetical protein